MTMQLVEVQLRQAIPLFNQKNAVIHRIIFTAVFLIVKVTIPQQIVSHMGIHIRPVLGKSCGSKCSIVLEHSHPRKQVAAMPNIPLYRSRSLVAIVK